MSMMSLNIELDLKAMARHIQNLLVATLHKWANIFVAASAGTISPYALTPSELIEITDEIKRSKDLQLSQSVRSRQFGSDSGGDGAPQRRGLLGVGGGGADAGGTGLIRLGRRLCRVPGGDDGVRRLLRPDRGRSGLGAVASAQPHPAGLRPGLGAV